MLTSSQIETKNIKFSSSLNLDIHFYYNRSHNKGKNLLPLKKKRENKADRKRMKQHEWLCPDTSEN